MFLLITSHSEDFTSLYEVSLTIKEPQLILKRFLKDLEIEIPFDLAIPLLGIYPKDYK